MAEPYPEAGGQCDIFIDAPPQGQPMIIITDNGNTKIASLTSGDGKYTAYQVKTGNYDYDPSHQDFGGSVTIYLINNITKERIDLYQYGKKYFEGGGIWIFIHA